MDDTVEDLDPAVQVCASVADWEAAAEAHPGALDGVDALRFLRNRCDFGGLTSALCDELARADTTQVSEGEGSNG